jgi:hypothetical protein
MAENLDLFQIYNAKFGFIVHQPDMFFCYKALKNPGFIRGFFERIIIKNQGFFFFLPSGPYQSDDSPPSVMPLEVSDSLLVLLLFSEPLIELEGKPVTGSIGPL